MAKKPTPIETAHFKFGLIAPVIQGTFPDASAAAYCRRVTEKPSARPDGTAFKYEAKTLEKWAQLYKQGGMDALMPSERSDNAMSRGATKTTASISPMTKAPVFWCSSQPLTLSVT
jgi:hypothetical protein